MRTKTKGYIVLALVLLAILTVVLCAMGGAFRFMKKSDTPEASVQPTVQVSALPTATVPGESSAPAVRSYSVIVSAGSGGAISPRGPVEVNEGESVSFSIVPEEGYELSGMTVDGQSVTPTSIYSFQNISSDHTLYAVFSKLPEETEPPEESTPMPETSAVPPSSVPSSATDIPPQAPLKPVTGA